MQPIPDLFPEPDIVVMLIEESMPWFKGWCFALALVFGVVICRLVYLAVHPSPVERLVRGKRVGV